MRVMLRLRGGMTVCNMSLGGRRGALMVSALDTGAIGGPGTLYCVLGQDTELSQCLYLSLSSICTVNGYW